MSKKMAGNVQSFDWMKMSDQAKSAYFKTNVPDCSFKVGYSPDDIKIIKSYKAILASVSPVFERMFKGGFVEAREPEGIEITDGKPKSFQKFLDHIVIPGNCVVIKHQSANDMLDIYYLARKYEIEALEKEFKGKLLAQPSAKFPCFVLVKALAIAKHVEDVDLLEKIKEKIRGKENIWGPYVHDLDEAGFLEWFTCVGEHFTAIQQFNWVETYAKFHHLERNAVGEGVLEKLLKLVRFEEMSAANFCEGPVHSTLLKPEEKKNFFDRDFQPLEDTQAVSEHDSSDGEDDGDEDEAEDDDEESDDSDVESDEEEVQLPKAKQPKLEKSASKENGAAGKVATSAVQKVKSNKDKKDKKKQQHPDQQKPGGERTLTGGVKIVDIRVGTGLAAKPKKKIQVYYEGRLKNNKVFESMKQGPGFKFKLDNGDVIKAWDVGIAGMKVGGKRRITCPPHMAYGSRGSPPAIPPNSTLVFEVELKSVS